MENSKKLEKTFFFFAAGICYILGAAIFYLDPMLAGNSNIEKFFIFIDQPTVHTMIRVFIGMGSLFSIGIVLVVKDLINKNGTFINWMTIMAVLSLAILGIENMRTLGMLMNYNQYFTIDTEVEKEALNIALTLMRFDPKGFLSYGIIGLWLIISNVIMHKQKVISKVLFVIGLVAGILVALTLVAEIFDHDPLFMICIILGGSIMVPAYYILMGVNVIQKKLYISETEKDKETVGAKV